MKYEKLTDLYGAPEYADSMCNGMPHYVADFERKLFDGIAGAAEIAAVFDNGSFWVLRPAEYYTVFEAMAIKDGVDLVRLEDGNLAFVGYYGGREDVVEIVTDPDGIAALIEREAEND